MSRLDIIDAAFHYSGDASRDQYVLLAFAPAGPTPTFRQICDFVEARAQRIPELAQRIVEVPGNLDFPRWVFDDAPAQSHVHEISDAPTWPEFRRVVDRLLTDPVDATRAAWHIHVAREVSGVPQTPGNAVVVVFQVSHALTDGRGASRLARLLFAPKPTETSAGHEPARTPTSLLPIAIASALALPFRTATARVAAWRARRDYERVHGSQPAQRDSPRPAIASNADPTPARVSHVHVCPPDLFAKKSVSVTTLGLAAVSLATERYLAEIGDGAPESLNSLVPMAVPEDARWTAVNRIVNGTVDLHVSIPDLRKRARAIRESLSRARAEIADPALLRWITVENRIPAPIFLAMRKLNARRTPPNHRVPESVLTNVTVVSVDRGDANLELCGRPATFTAGFPMLGPARSLTHGFYGLGDAVSVCVVACPDTFPDHERYAGILADAVADVADATS
ncbi:wax ester/triacylglycerol synthase domain-containing protein [Rhodococcus kyotonensis]|uniref:Uncharacterized protein n=1 Tax=Rhodococcoides kyotonense TaxID=398843 RepID=A0A177YFD2_9NOCA|nr:wax ester/triacylglycerol synthase domain-containing protein [Rhodococcus kyotonensis]NIL75253.1 hypothetical protein [Rhodococcus sp. B10]OAK53929.1 hypothetical protein A3K89_21735 [Rhodococcus kyotonensis]